jgi:CelD/BcsL family acetyltransferase involved in cellulose biosynthesis
MNWKIYNIDQFEKQHQHWHSLNVEGVASPLLNPDFISLLLKFFGNGKEILVCYENNGQAKAMAILRQSRSGSWETFQPSQAPIGAWIHSANLNWNILLASLIKKLPGFTLIIGVTQQDPDLLTRPVNSSTLKTLDYVQTVRISLDGGFDEYWNSRGKNLRSNLKKQRKKLEKDSIKTCLELSTSPDDVDQAIIDYGAIESAGWKADGDTAIHPNTVQGKFYKEMMESFCQNGRCRIYRYWYNDRIVAMDLCIQDHGCLVILKTTYDENVGKTTSPASLMRQDEFREIFSDCNVNKIEFYGKMMDWHTKWGDEIRTLYHVNQYRWSILHHLRHGIKNIKNII